MYVNVVSSRRQVGLGPLQKEVCLRVCADRCFLSLRFDRRALKQPRSWCDAGVHVSCLGETCTSRLLNSCVSVVAIETDSGSLEK